MASVDKFSNVFMSDSLSDEMKKRKVYLAEYVAATQDKYMCIILRKIIQREKLLAVEIERVDDLMAHVSLEEMLVNILLAGGDPETEVEDKLRGAVKDAPVESLIHSDVVARVRKITEKGKGRLVGWDEKFVYGDTGEALLEQSINRNGWLSEKQMRQIVRIEQKLRI